MTNSGGVNKDSLLRGVPLDAFSQGTAEEKFIIFTLNSFVLGSSVYKILPAFKLLWD